MKTRVLPFLREEGGRVTTFAVVSLGFSGGPRSKGVSAQRALELLTSAVTIWAKSTKEGRKCWGYSGGDLNIGDLAQYEVQFQKWLEEAPLSLKTFEIVYLGESSEGSVPFDRVLGVKGEIEE